MMCHVVQGYGLTETMAGSCMSIPGRVGADVGLPLPGVKVRLESVPDMNYDALADPPRGEICIGGDTVFSGYYKREEMTKEVLGASRRLPRVPWGPQEPPLCRCSLCVCWGDHLCLDPVCMSHPRDWPCRHLSRTRCRRELRVSRARRMVPHRGHRGDHEGRRLEDH
mmetsp:Transcript_1527/g.3438  ORF Transcript_1527/g.3438 Transcript_1527/m.3438 type:complete len:167 (-) Transcript_1527:645-1145(-)